MSGLYSITLLLPPKNIPVIGGYLSQLAFPEDEYFLVDKKRWTKSNSAYWKGCGLFKVYEVWLILVLNFSVFYAISVYLMWSVCVFFRAVVTCECHWPFCPASLSCLRYDLFSWIIVQINMDGWMDKSKAVVQLKAPIPWWHICLPEWRAPSGTGRPLTRQNDLSAMTSLNWWANDVVAWKRFQFAITKKPRVTRSPTPRTPSVL